MENFERSILALSKLLKSNWGKGWKGSTPCAHFENFCVWFALQDPLSPLGYGSALLDAFCKQYKSKQLF